jgi:hypothetical protein
VTVGLPALDGGARRIPGLRFHNPSFGNTSYFAPNHHVSP